MIGLLLDSLSQNTGDQAILQVMQQFLKGRGYEFEVLSPLGFTAEHYHPIIIGGGHLIREKGDWYYDTFRVPGPHILNVPGVSASCDLGYLAEYSYVSVRSSRDRERVASAAPTAVVSPCVSLSLEPDRRAAASEEGSIGFHFHEQSWAACGDDSLFREFRDYPQSLIPITYYNGDYWLLRNLSDRIPVAHTLLPRLEPRGVLNEISRMRALVCSSLHASIFAYSQNVPFISFGFPDKIVEFMEDRGLQDWIFRDSRELRSKLAGLLSKPPDYSAALQRDLKKLDEHFKRLIDCLPKASVSGSHAPSATTPAVEHKLLVEHHNRLAVLERIADRLIAADERIEAAASRHDSRLNNLRRIVEQREGTETIGLPAPLAPGLSDLPFGSVEAPAPDSRVCGICEASGWAICESGISEVVGFVDGRLVGTAEYGTPRPDVIRAYPGFPDSRRPGWKLIFDAGQFAEGQHELLLQARSRAGLTRDLAALPIAVGPVESLATKSLLRDESGDAPSDGKETGPVPNDVAARISQAVDSLPNRVHELEGHQEEVESALNELARRDSATTDKLDRALAALSGLEGVRSEISALVNESAAGISHSVDSLSNRVLELECRREQIESALGELAWRGSEVAGKLNAVLAALSGLERLGSDFEGAKLALKSTQAEIGTHQDQIASLAAQLAIMLRDVADLRREGAELEERTTAGEENVSAVSQRIAEISAEITLVSHDLSALPQQLSCLSEAAIRSQAVLNQFQQENRAAVRKIVDVLVNFQNYLQSNTDQIRAICQSRIWKTLQALAVPFYKLFRLLDRRDGGSRSTGAPQLELGLEHLLSGTPARPTEDELPSEVGHPPSGTLSRGTPVGWEYGGDDHPDHQPENPLRIGIDSRIPESIIVAKGNALCLHGWCYHASLRIRRLEILVGKTRHPVKVYGTVRSDVFSKHYPHMDSSGHSFRSGFWSIILLPEIHRAEEVDLSLRATLETGEQSVSKIARTTLLPASVDSGPSESSDQPLVAICMATYNPPLALFRRQIESLISQSFSNWICIISDDCSRSDIYAEIVAITSSDGRFRVFQTPGRYGFYRNFEYCLSLVPPEATFVALCDHDDAWYSDKLESLVAAFDPATSLSYSDMRIVDVDGKVLSKTYWTTRTNNYTSFTSLLVANTVTGAASMFRRNLLSVILPFPELLGEPFHDHWIACVALATGKIAYIDRPLYDYVQHSRNVIGHFAPSGVSWLRNAWVVLRNRAALDYTMALWRNIYFGDVLRIEVIAKIIELRGGGLVPRSKRRVLRLLSRMDEGLFGAVWLLLRRVREIWRGNETLGAETRLLRGVLWRYCATLRSRLGPGPVRRAVQISTAVPTDGSTFPKTLDTVDVIRQKVAPLRLAVAPDTLRRVNLLIPTIDFDYVFGGYIAKFCLAQKLANMGLRVRIVIVDYCDYKPAFWRQQLRSFEGIAGVLDSCELAYAFDRATPLPASKNDAFVATTWWTAHIARQATKDLGHREFLYLIQEYEPFTFPMGTFASLARETYNWPHRALFSTRFLRQYFRQERLGVFANTDGDGEERCAVFDNAITDVGSITAATIRARTERRLLFYARPEGHASRNMFELGVLALCAAIEANAFDSRWEFIGIGSVGPASRVPLAKGRYMQLLPRQSQAEYKKVLMGHDIGLSLMYTPHPSLVPIEMASAGMVTVTNTFGNKTVEALQGISSNLIAVAPTVEDLASALRAAVLRVEDFDARAAGADVNWCKHWDQAFHTTFLLRVAEFIKETSE